MLITAGFILASFLNFREAAFRYNAVFCLSDGFFSQGRVQVTFGVNTSQGRAEGYVEQIKQRIPGNLFCVRIVYDLFLSMLNYVFCVALQDRQHDCYKILETAGSLLVEAYLAVLNCYCEKIVFHM